jgi:tripartite-type tricarboxylate transporter receptor subunit TctC
VQRTFSAIAVVAAVLAACLSAPDVRAQADYPNRPIRLIVGYPAGTMADVSTRVLASRMSQTLGQQIVIENKPGAGSSLAAEAAARAPKDGYTLYLCASANVANQAMGAKLPFDMEKDFAPIALVSVAAVVLVVNPSVGVNSVKELVALAKSKPGEINYASVGIGSALHLSAELLSQRAGIKLQHVPYQGSPQAVNDLVAGRTQMMFAPAATVVPLIQSGKLTVLASATLKRSGVLPDVPTMAEIGMSEFDTSIWSGLLAPAGTPREVVDKLGGAVDEATKSAEVVNAWRPLGVDPLTGGPQEFARYIASELKRWNEVGAAAGLNK